MNQHMASIYGPKVTALVLIPRDQKEWGGLEASTHNYFKGKDQRKYAALSIKLYWREL